MRKIQGEFSLQLYKNNNKGQPRLVKQVEFGNSYLIETLDKNSGWLLFHERIYYVSFSVEV